MKRTKKESPEGDSNLSKVNIAITKSVVKDDQPTWAGARLLMTKPREGTPEHTNWRIIQLTAKALEISPFCINILGDLPYVNRLGLSTKARKYEPNYRIEYEWVQEAKDDVTKAICKATLIDGRGRALANNILGECSPSTIKMGTLKGYQNHMAQTRAHNRVIKEAFEDRIHLELVTNLEKMIRADEKKEQREIKDEDVSKIVGSISASAEEMPMHADDKKSETFSMDKYRSLIEFAVKHGAELGSEQKFIEDAIGQSVDWENITNKTILQIQAPLMNKFVSNGGAK